MVAPVNYKNYPMGKKLADMLRSKSLPEYADDAGTIGIGSDRYPVTVVSDDGKIVAVQSDDHKVVGGSVLDGSAVYEYHRNYGGSIEYFRRRSDGKFESVVRNLQTNRWNKTGYTGHFHIGRRVRYYDPHF